jgi:enolase
MSTIKHLRALEILDSRGRPTVKAWCELEAGILASASVPSGASTGSAEALELRDGETRYQGLGCRKAVAHINLEINQALGGRVFAQQADLDHALIELDGTSNKSRLGANAILAVSLAFARAVATEAGLPLYQHFANLLGRPLETLPRLTVNLFSGGKHAGGQVPFQDVLIVPTSARSIAESLEMTYAVYCAASARASRRYGMRELRADEGGLAPPFENVNVMLEEAVESVRDAGLKPGLDVSLAIDVASSHFYNDGHYNLGNQVLDAEGMIEFLANLVKAFPIVSLEDGLAEESWDGWPDLRQRIANQALVLGDDFLCTNPARIQRAISSKAANALLLKVNQIGTLTEAGAAARLAHQAGWQVTVSARSGETEDNWLADLAVAWGQQIKVGSITQSERLAKYNRLLEIEAESNLPIVSWPLDLT